jgi:hypothetical protein
VTDVNELRQLIAAKHGLDARAARLLVGESIEELERSAAKLAQLVGARREQEAEPEPEGFFAAAARAKAARKQELAAIFTGHAPQPRDERGRFAEFNRGARASAPPPPETHGQTLARLLRSGQANAGRRL